LKDIRYAGWSTAGDTIAYVRNNDLYIWRDGNSTQITYDGSADIFNGVPDWVYEEEIFAETNTLWFSPDGRYLTFLRFNETGVPTYRVPYYMKGSRAPPYPEYLELRYPKAGQTNPTVTVHLVNLDDLSAGATQISFDAFKPDDLVISEVAWVTDAHSHFVFRSLNRVQDHEVLALVDVESCSVSKLKERKEESGWIDSQKAIHYLEGLNSFVDLSDESGFNHIYLHYLPQPSIPTPIPVPLTSGDWEVTNILYADRLNIYYQSTERHSTERHIYVTSMFSWQKEAIVDISKEGYYSASFSSQGGFYVLSYNGPDLPRQELYSTQDVKKPLRVLSNNAKLEKKLSDYNLPTTTWTTIRHPDGFEMNAIERLPPNFDPSKKYPLLLNPYGGPGSQQTGKYFRQVDWNAYLASDPELNYVVLIVDNRGTGFKGRNFRSAVTGQLGT
jgi:dipeptidyl-peptidase 4